VRQPGVDEVSTPALIILSLVVVAIAGARLLGLA